MKKLIPIKSLYLQVENDDRASQILKDFDCFYYEVKHFIDKYEHSVPALFAKPRIDHSCMTYFNEKKSLCQTPINKAIEKLSKTKRLLMLQPTYQDQKFSGNTKRTGWPIKAGCPFLSFTQF